MADERLSEEIVAAYVDLVPGREHRVVDLARRTVVKRQAEMTVRTRRCRDAPTGRDGHFGKARLEPEGATRHERASRHVALRPDRQPADEGRPRDDVADEGWPNVGPIEEESAHDAATGRPTDPVQLRRPHDQLDVGAVLGEESRRLERALATPEDRHTHSAETA